MTLMVLQFDTPNPDSVSAGALHEAVLKQWPSFLSYALTFAVVANYWIVHHRTFNFIRSHDMGLMWLNIGLLFSISFLPFPTDVAGEYPDSPFAVTFYACAMAATSLLSTLIWLYVTHRPRLLVSSVTPTVARYHVFRGLGVMSIFLGSIAVAQWSTDVARMCWLSIFLYQRCLPCTTAAQSGASIS
jgi:uncharacterized membrane protein